ncbi:MAG: YbiU family protein, partial [Acidimicrobiales bacterium]
DRTWFDPDRNIIYPDRIRRRPPGTTSGGLGPHIDTGTIDLWMTTAFQESFRRVFAGEPLEHDPWDGAHRSDASKFPGSTMCSVFRTFQGWTALSQMKQGQGVLHVVPIPLAIARLLLRPLLDDVAEDDLCGVAVNKVLPVTTPWHDRLLDGLSPVPDLEPGDSVWWHADLIHSVAPVTNQEGWASLMYIPAAPWNDRNRRYAESAHLSLRSGESPDDFPSEHYEATWNNRFALEGLNELGRAGLGMS